MCVCMCACVECLFLFFIPVHHLFHFLPPLSLPFSSSFTSFLLCLSISAFVFPSSAPFLFSHHYTTTLLCLLPSPPPPLLLSPPFSPSILHFVSSLSSSPILSLSYAGNDQWAFYFSHLSIYLFSPSSSFLYRITRVISPLMISRLSGFGRGAAAV